MQRFLKNLIERQILRRRSSITDVDDITPYIFAKAYTQFKLSLKHNIRSTLFIAAGIMSAAFGLKGFLLPNHFIDGGVTGISLLSSAITKWPISIFIVLLNLPFIVMGYKTIGTAFSIKTTLAIIGLALVLFFVDFPDVTHDKLLVAVFGGFFLGAGIGLAVRGGSVIDGTEVLAIYLSKKLRVTMGDIIIIINTIIFLAAAYLLSIESALYSMITYMAASKTLDFVIEGIDEYIGVTIISSHFDEIRFMVNEKMGRGSTVYSGKAGFGKRGHTRDVDIIYTVITRLELNKLMSEMEKIDKNAFVVMTPVKDTRGGMIRQRPLKH